MAESQGEYEGIFFFLASSRVVMMIHVVLGSSFLPEWLCFFSLVVQGKGVVVRSGAIVIFRFLLFFKSCEL